MELLKLTYAHGRDASEAVARAQELEKYVGGVEEPAPESGRGTLHLPKKADKATSPR